MRAVIFVTFALLVGCSSSFERVQAMRDAAPEWYEASKLEVSGEGYPSIATVPVVTAENRPGQQLAAAGQVVLADLEKFLSDPRAAAPEETPEEILAWAATTRRAVEGRLPASDFLTDEDVAALHAIFDRPRGRL